MIILRRSGLDPQFDKTIETLKGKHAGECLKKIEQMNGIIIAADLDKGQWQDTVGETLYFIFSSTPHAFASLRTDDSCVSFTALGNRVEQGVDRLIEMAVSGMDPAALEQRVAYIAPVMFAAKNGLCDLPGIEPSYFKDGFMIDIDSGQGWYEYRLVVNVDEAAQPTKIQLMRSSPSGAQDVASGQEALDLFKDAAALRLQPV